MSSCDKTIVTWKAFPYLLCYFVAFVFWLVPAPDYIGIPAMFHEYAGLAISLIVWMRFAVARFRKESNITEYLIWLAIILVSPWIITYLTYEVVPKFFDE